MTKMFRIYRQRKTYTPYGKLTLEEANEYIHQTLAGWHRKPQVLHVSHTDFGYSRVEVGFTSKVPFTEEQYNNFNA